MMNQQTPQIKRPIKVLKGAGTRAAEIEDKLHRHDIARVRLLAEKDPDLVYQIAIEYKAIKKKIIVEQAQDVV